MAPFGLPPAWNPGYALPSNVEDEGLERRGLVTKQMPRGTYDDPRVGTGGYVTPSYVRQEGYGQGAYVTKWAPRGTIAERVPQWIQRQPTVVSQRSIGRRANVVTIQRRAFGRPSYVGMSGLSAVVDNEPEMPALFQQYGDNAAQEILSRIQEVPPAMRKQTLRAIMDSVDKTLWNRTAEITRRYVSQGQAAGAAFPRALSRALATGIAAEMIRAGQTGQAPQPNSLLGLGCDYARRAQGAPGLGSTLTDVLSKFGMVTSTPSGDNRPGGGVGESAATKDKLRGTNSPFEFVYDPVGPPKRPRVDGENSVPVARSVASIPPHWVPWFQQTLAAVPGQKGAAPAPQNPIWQALGFAPGQMVRMDLVHGSELVTSGDAKPVDGFKTPDGVSWDVFIQMLPNKQNPDRVGGYVRANSGLVGGFGSTFVGRVVGGVGAVLGKLACGVATAPGAPQAGAVAGMGAGVGPAPGAAGAQVAKGMCAGGMPPMFPPQQDMMLPLVLIGGGVLLTAALLNKKKKAPSTP